MDSATISLDLLLSENPPMRWPWLEAGNAVIEPVKKCRVRWLRKPWAIIEADETLKGQDIIVVYKEGWHKGVLGIVASRIVDKYYRLTMVISCLKTGWGQGSARSIEGFHLHEALTSCSGVLENYGGHKRAAGSAVQIWQYWSFPSGDERFCTASLPQEKFISTLEYLLWDPFSHIDF